MRLWQRGYRGERDSEALGGRALGGKPGGEAQVPTWSGAVPFRLAGLGGFWGAGDEAWDVGAQVPGNCGWGEQSWWSRSGILASRAPTFMLFSPN